MARTDPQMNLRLPPELKSAIEAAAQENGRSMNAEIVFRLEQSFTLVSAAPISNGLATLSSNIKMMVVETIAVNQYARSLEEYLNVVDPGGPRPPRPIFEALHK